MITKDKELGMEIHVATIILMTIRYVGVTKTLDGRLSNNLVTVSCLPLQKINPTYV